MKFIKKLIADEEWNAFFLNLIVYLPFECSYKGISSVNNGTIKNNK